jgi:hypothetical protein
MRTLLLTILFLALGPGAAAAQWEQTQFGAAGQVTPGAELLFGSATGFLAWGDASGLRLGSWRPGSAPVVRRRLTGRLMTDAVAAGRYRIFFGRETGTPERPRLHATVVSTTGRVLSTQRIASPRGAYAHAAARSPRGELALAWIENEARGGLVLKAYVRPSGGRFRRVYSLRLGQDSHPGAAEVAAGYTRSGELVLAFTAQRRTDRVEAVIGRPGRWRRQVLGRHLGIADISVASGPRVVVAWQTQDGGEEANRAAETRAALLEPGRRTFSRTQLFAVPGGPERWAGEIRAAVGDDGAAAVLWSHPGPDRRQALTIATAPPRAPLGPAAVLDAGAAAGDLVFAPDGRLLAVWSRILTGNYQEPDQVVAAQRVGEVFGPPEVVGDGNRPRAAYAGGRFTLVFNKDRTIVLAVRTG